MPKPFDIEKFNSILKTHNQELRAVVISGTVVELSNSLRIIDTAGVARCKKRVMRGHVTWKENFDLIYGTNLQAANDAEHYARSTISASGGKKCQQKHGGKIKKNLNTGTPWNKGLTGMQTSWSKGLNKTNNASLKRLSESRSGSGNPMYGTKMSDDNKQYLSTLMKQKILTGEFTPNSNNRNTHWDSTFNGKKYRSSWEAIYHSNNEADEYEKLRIPYTFDGEEYIYIVDFVNSSAKTATEVKPMELCGDLKTQAKLSALTEWCNKRNYSFILANKEYLLALGCPENLTGFDDNTQDKIRKFYEIN